MKVNACRRQVKTFPLQLSKWVVVVGMVLLIISCRGPKEQFMMPASLRYPVLPIDTIQVYPDTCCSAEHFMSILFDAGACRVDIGQTIRGMFAGLDSVHVRDIKNRISQRCLRAKQAVRKLVQ